MAVRVDIQRFEKDTRRFFDRLDTKSRRFAAGYGELLCNAIGMSTPFDTGRAAASWTAAINSPNRAHKPPEFVAGSIQDAVKQQSINLGGFILGDSIVIHNSLNYIGDLNNGTSRQAPAMFVEITVQSAAPGIIAQLKTLGVPPGPA